MKLNIASLKKRDSEGFELDDKIDLTSENCEEYKFISPVEAKYSGRIIGSNVLFKCNYKVRVEFVCTRCLKEYEKDIEGEFEVLYLNPKDYKGYLESEESEHFFTEEEVIKEKLENETINADEIVRENVIVNLPYANKCSDSCKIEYNI